MSGKEKLEHEYQSSIAEIEKMKTEAIQRINEVANRIRSEAAKVGESVENSFSEQRGKNDGKKS